MALPVGTGAIKLSEVTDYVSQEQGFCETLAEAISEADRANKDPIVDSRRFGRREGEARPARQARAIQEGHRLPLHAALRLLHRARHRVHPD